MSQELGKLNTNSFNNYKRRTPVGLGFQSLFYSIGLIFKFIKIKILGSGTQLKQPRFFQPIKEIAEVIEIKEIKKIRKKRAKKKKVRDKIIIRFPEVDFVPPEIDWIKIMPFVKAFLKYTAVVISCLIIMVGTIWFFSDRILAVLSKNHEIFQNEKVIQIIKTETIHYDAQIENIDDRVKELEIGKANFIYFQHLPKKYQVLNSKKTKYIVR